MPDAGPRRTGFVAELWRYPVKSMRGEQIEASEVTDHGLLGDRVCALVDLDSGKIVSAKNPRKWPDMFDFRSELMRPPRLTDSLPPARITFPDGESGRSDELNIDERLSAPAGTEVRLATSVPDDAQIEGYWPNYPWLPVPDDVFEINLAPGTFFDGARRASCHDATLECFRSLSPQSRFDAGSFPAEHRRRNERRGLRVRRKRLGRPNHLDRRLGTSLNHRAMRRCVMTTLAQGDLPKDPNVLRTIVEHNEGNAGVLADGGPGRSHQSRVTPSIWNS